MKTSWFRIGRRATRLSAALLLALVGILTVAMFCTTGRPVPLGFVPSTEPAFGLDLNTPERVNGKRQTMWLQSEDRTCGIAFKLQDGMSDWYLPTSQELILTVVDFSTGRKLGWFRDSCENLSSIALTPDKQRLLSVAKGKLRVRRLLGADEAMEEFCDEVEIEKHSLSSLSFEFSQDSRHVLIFSNSFSNKATVCYDLLDRKKIPVAAIPENERLPGFIVCGFFDSKGMPKVLVIDQVWDLASDKRDVTLEPDASEGIHYHHHFYVGNAPFLATFFSDLRLLIVHSLDDGTLVQRAHVPTDLHPLFQFSPNGQFLIGRSKEQLPFVDLAKKYSSRLEETLNKLLPEQERSVLLNLKTGDTWCDKLGKGNCSISQDGSQMMSFTDDGHYVYDVPPKLQLFTPWSWAALGAWLGLFCLWRRLVQRERRMPAAGQKAI